MIDWQKSANWGFGAFAILWLAITFAPLGLWFTVGDIVVKDAVVGVAPEMQVERTIHRPFVATWRVELERKTGDGFTLIATANGEGRYAVDNRLPANLDLDWWTYPKVLRPEAGQYRLETCWSLILWGTAHRPLCVTSNTFTITETDQ